MFAQMEVRKTEIEVSTGACKGFFQQLSYKWRFITGKIIDKHLGVSENGVYPQL